MSKKIRNTSIRIISLISCFMVLISALIFPAAATDTGDQTSAYQPQFIDLFEYDYDFTLEALVNGSVLISSIINDPVVNFSDSYSARISWGDSKDRYFADYLYLCVNSSSMPLSVTFDSRDLLGTLVGVSEGFYFYKFNVSGTFSASFSFTITMPTTFRGRVSLESAYAVVDQSSSISEVNFRVRGQFVSDGQYYFDTLFDQAVTLPYEYKKTYSNDRPNAGAPEQMFFDVNFPMPVPYAESISVSFLSSNVWPNYYDQDTLSQGGVQLLENGSTKEILPYTVTDVIAYSHENGQPNYIYTVTVDLNGIEFTNSNFLVFRFYMARQYSNYDTSNTANFYYVNFLSCTYKTVSYSKPWYVRFFYWIQDEFTSLKDTIKDAFGVGQAAPDISDQQQQIEDSVDDMDQMGDEFENAQQEMDELMPNMPSWDETGLEGFDTIVVSYIDQFRPVFLAIYDNNIINQILTYTFLFALGGFILFGER